MRLDRLENIALPPNVSENTHCVYSVDVRVHLIPGIDARWLDRLEPEHAEKLYAEMQRNGSSAGTAPHVHRTIRNALNEAVRRGHLALIRRQVRDWTRFVVYLAAVGTATLLGTPGSQDAARIFLGIAAGLMVIAPLHTVVAFSPAAGVSSWREARAARDSGTRQQLVMEAAGPEDLQ